jgi:hypothetical protein
MTDASNPSWIRALRPLGAMTLVAALLVLLGRAVMPWDKMFPDVICFWTSGKILGSGQSPYDPELQTRIQRELGWDRETAGRGIYDFLPFNYPPWMALLWVLFVPMGFDAARVAWFFLNVEMALVAGYLLRQTVPTRALWLPVVLVPTFLFSLACVTLAQTAILVFFLICLVWWLLDRRWDRSAGIVMAWLTLKPQLTAVLLAGLLLWTVRQRRWGVVKAFAIALTVLTLGCLALVPWWPVQFVNALQHPPPPTEYFPWIGNSWLLVLRTCGLQGWPLWLFYLGVALPFLALVVRAAVDRARPLSDVLALGCLAAFFVAPYERHYDFPVLLIPLLILLGSRLGTWSGRALLMALLVLPYLQIFLLINYKAQHDPDARFLLESTFFWVPVVLTVAWFASGRFRAQPPPGTT